VRSTLDPSERAPALVLQHGVHGPPGLVGEWLHERGVPFVVHRAWEAPPPPPEDFAFVISLGSQHSAVASEPAWVHAELEMLRAAVAGHVPVLGLCFGGQALSLVLGGHVEPLQQPEIGWFSLESQDSGVPSGPWLHYHFEQLRIPPGAVELARSPAGPAAFRHGPHLGLQFHPEADAEIVARWVNNDAKLPEVGIEPGELAAESVRHARSAREPAFRLFDQWLEAARAG
jgi:GMP synthase-like glutamine amidotransferase